jgi:hypothetical protein
MGLDSFAMAENNTPMDGKLFTHIPPVLCGGMFSDGESSIRGKVYDKFVHTNTGVSLYQEKISYEQIGDMLQKFTDKPVEPYDLSATEVHALVEWFRTIHRNKGYIIGWW